MEGSAATTRLTSRSGFPLQVKSAWSEKRIATRQPDRSEWTEYEVLWRVEAQEVVHATALLVEDGHGRYARLPEESFPESVVFRLSFARYRGDTWPEWPAEKLVRVGLSLSGANGNTALSVVVVSEALWTDPREATRVLPTGQFESGALLTLATIEPWTISARAILLGSDDVRVSHGRWKADLRKLDLLPPALKCLADGRRSGEVAA